MPDTTMNKWALTDVLEGYYNSGLLLSFHAVNLHWRNRSTERPPWAHCVPLGLENRDTTIGVNIRKYLIAMKEHLLDSPHRYSRHNHTWLLIPESFSTEDSRKPDRFKAFQKIAAYQNKRFRIVQSLSHDDWLKSLSRCVIKFFSTYICGILS